MTYGNVKKITKEQYDRAMENNGSICKDDIPAVFTEAERWGYGLYGNSVFEKDGEYFVQYTLGSTCD